MEMLKDLCDLKVLQCTYVNTNENKADPLTKPMGPGKIIVARVLLSVR
jgi:hypothetical protein